MKDAIQEAVLALGENPFPGNSKALDHNLNGYYSLRVDEFRIVYGVDESARAIEIVGVAHRKEVYDIVSR